jgi:hypothetical protein
VLQPPPVHHDDSCQLIPPVHLDLQKVECSGLDAVCALACVILVPISTGTHSPTSTTMWDSFFNRAYEIGEACLASGMITAEDVEDQEAYLYLGLPALTLFDGVMRSLPLPGEEMVMEDGSLITHSTCPSEFMGMYEALLELKVAVLKEKLSDAELTALQMHILHTGHEGSDVNPLQGFSTERVTVMNRITAGVHSVATAVSQKPFFKTCFNSLLTLLAAQVTTHSE